nr:uncharacterized protein LOC122268266 [Parasteatoda tepidariorum]
MLLIFTFVGSLLLVQSTTINDTDTYDSLNLSTSAPFEFTKPNFYLEINATISSTQESNYLNNTQQESTSWTSNSLTFKPKEIIVVTPTNATITEAQLVINNSINISDLKPYAIEKDVSVLPTLLYVNQSEILSIPQEDESVPLEISSTDGTLQTSQPTSQAVLAAVNVTVVEESVEQNAIVTTELGDTSTDKNLDIVVGRKCTRLFQDSFLWNETDGGMLALKSCPTGYQGNMYRPCFTNGKWGKVDFSECRLEHLGRMRHMIFHQVQKGMMGNMYILVDEFSRYISSVDMKSPMDRLEAFEILNTFLKLDMNLKLDKSKDTKYIQTLLHASNELIRKKTVSFAPGSQKNQLITQKVVEMIHHLTSFAERALRGLLKTQKKHIIFKSTPNVAMYLYRGKLSGQLALANISDDHYGAESPYSSLENTLERSAYALIGIKGLRDILSTNKYLVISDVGVTTIVSPLNTLNHMQHPPTYDVGLQMEKDIPEGYIMRCGQLWNMSHLWNVNDCSAFSVKGDMVTCRCRNLGSIALLLEEIGVGRRLASESPMGTMITISCITSLCLILLTFVVNFLLKK